MHPNHHRGLLAASLTAVVACGGTDAAPPATPSAPTAAPAAPPPSTAAGAQPAAATTPKSPGSAATPATASQPSAEQTKTVEAFAGDWSYEASVVPAGGKPVKATIGISCKKVALGKGVACVSGDTLPGMGSFEGNFLVGLDPADKTVHVMAVTSADELRDHRCSWKDDKTLACEPLRVGLGGQPVTEDLSFVFDGATSSFKSVTTLKNGSKIVFDGNNGKRGSLPPKKEPAKGKAAPPSAEQKKTVDAFSGDWKIDGSVTTADGKSGKAPITMSGTRSALGKAVAGTMSGSTPSGPLEAAFLVGYDPLDKTLHFMTVTSDDEVHDHRCKWSDDKNVACDPLRAGMGGQPMTKDLSFAFGADGTISFKSVVTARDGAKVTFEGKGKR